MGQGAYEPHLGGTISAEAANVPRSGRFPLVRLLQLVVLLQTERCPNARQLAEICEVSRRTIYRDLSTLDDAGIRIVYRPDRQGYQLAKSMFLSAPRIDEHEAMALLVLTRSWAAHEDLGLSRAAGSAVDKLLQALPEPLRENLLAVAEVVGDRSQEERDNARESGLHALLLKSLASRLQVRVWARGAAGEEVDSTKLAIYRLSRIDGRWCLIGRSSRDCKVCLIPIHSIERAESTEEAYTIPPRFNLERFLSQIRIEIGETLHATVG